MAGIFLCLTKLIEWGAPTLHKINKHKKLITKIIIFSPDIYNVSGYLYNYGYEEN